MDAADRIIHTWSRNHADNTVPTYRFSKIESQSGAGAKHQGKQYGCYFFHFVILYFECQERPAGPGWLCSKGRRKQSPVSDGGVKIRSHFAGESGQIGYITREEDEPPPLIGKIE
jgi:hypothetical protein